MPQSKRSGPSKLEEHRAAVKGAAGNLKQLGYTTSILQAAINLLKKREKKQRELEKLKRQVAQLEKEL